ncbi:hypothetical protein RvY_02525 [Ramazzottius varieornatus]|uniref:Uncharacterized protein n=1 Tax=Ramazzottius varieornatus TaxID=947166 RepID=A0A1D1UK19_RAMVA|nr:hypothetical protein RvY_02525 [Ramazzottius varieornatus]
MEGDQNIPPPETAARGPSTSKPKAKDVPPPPAARNSRQPPGGQPVSRGASRGTSAHVQPPRNAPLTKPARPVAAPRGVSAAPTARAARLPAVPAVRNATSRAVSQATGNTSVARRPAQKAAGVAVAAKPAARYMSYTISAAAHSIKSQSNAAIPRPAVAALRVTAPTRAVRAPVKTTAVAAAAPKPQPKAAPKPAPAAAAPSRPAVGPAVRPVARPTKTGGHLQSVASMNGRNGHAVPLTSGPEALPAQPAASQVHRATKTPAAESSSSQPEQAAVAEEGVLPANQPTSNEEQDQPSSSSDVPLPPLVDFHAVKDVGAAVRPGRESFVPNRPRNEQIQYFRDLINKTTTYLTDKSSQWEKVLDTPAEAASISEEGVEFIRLATGQSRLFMAQKLQQFVGLVDDCEFHRGERETSPLDLAGFWDMIKMQVSGIKDKFDHIEALAGNKWVAPPSTSTAHVERKSKNAGKKSVLKPVDANMKPNSTSLGNTATVRSKMAEVIKQKRRELSAGTSSDHHEAEAVVDGPEAQRATEGPETTIYLDAETNSYANDETVMVVGHVVEITEIQIAPETVSA